MPAITIERQKMSVEMWQSLKEHILRRREKRKLEEELDAEEKRHKKEQELKRNRDAMTLKEVKEQLAKLEEKLNKLKDEKHQVICQLKKVINEKKKREPEFLPPQQVLAAQQIGAQSYTHPYFIPQQTLINVQRPQPTVYPRLTPINTQPQISAAQQMINTSTIQSNAHSASPANLVNVKRTPVKRPHEQSPSPPSSIPYTGVLPMYKTSVSYTPSVPKTTPSGHYQLYYPAGAPQVAFDAKGNPYHILPSGAAFPASTGGPPPQGPSQSAEQPMMEANEYEANKFYHQFRGMAPMMPQQSSIIPIQPSQSKPGGITSGFPVQRVGIQINNSQSIQNREPPRQYPRYY